MLLYLEDLSAAGSAGDRPFAGAVAVRIHRISACFPCLPAQEPDANSSGNGQGGGRSRRRRRHRPRSTPFGRAPIVSTGWFAGATALSMRLARSYPLLHRLHSSCCPRRWRGSAPSVVLATLFIAWRLHRHASADAPPRRGAGRDRASAHASSASDALRGVAPGTFCCPSPGDGADGIRPGGREGTRGLLEWAWAA